MSTIVVYVSKTGNTKAVSEYIAKRLSCDIADIGKSSAGNGISMDGYDNVIVGSGVYAGRIPKAIKGFLSETNFEGKDVRMFLCCALKDEKGTEQMRSIISQYPSVSSMTFFSGKKKGLEVNEKADDFVKDL